MTAIACILMLSAASAFSSPCADAEFLERSYSNAITLYVQSRSDEALLTFQAIVRCDPGNKPARLAVQRLAREIKLQGTRQGAPGRAHGGQALVADGEKYYRIFNCGHCHSLKGSGGKSAPSLDGVFSRASLIAIQKHLRVPKDGQAFGKMPDLVLRPDEVNALAAFLVSTRSEKNE